jgi:hypothetical protein
VLARLKRAGEDLAGCWRTAVEAAQHLEEGLGHLDVRRDTRPEPIVERELLGCCPLVRADSLARARCLLRARGVLVVLGGVDCIDHGRLQGRLELQQPLTHQRVCAKASGCSLDELLGLPKLLLRHLAQLRERELVVGKPCDDRALLVDGLNDLLLLGDVRS